MYTDNLSVSKWTQLAQMIINPELKPKKTSLLTKDYRKLSNENLKSYFRLNVNIFTVSLH